MKASQIKVWIFPKSEKPKDWPQGSPRAWSTVTPDESAKTINDIFSQTDPKNTKGLKFVPFEKP
jgi:hypothetical protein